MRRQLRERSGDTGAPEQPVVLLPRVEVDRSMLDTWAEAASQARVELPEWIVRVLTRAAAATLAGATSTALPPGHPA